MPFTLAWKGEPKIEAPPKSSPIGKELEGSWQGALNVQGNTLRLVLDLATEAGSGVGDSDQSGSEWREDPCRSSVADRDEDHSPRQRYRCELRRVGDKRPDRGHVVPERPEVPARVQACDQVTLDLIFPWQE